MKEMLGNEYPAFLSSFSAPRTYGLRINTSKITCEDFENLSPFPTRQIPWIKNGYFYDEDIRPSRCPYYQAGLYYLQEPSAMTPASASPSSRVTESWTSAQPRAARQLQQAQHFRDRDFW